MPAANFMAGVHQRSEASCERERGTAALEPDRLVRGAGEAIPALGFHEISGRRDGMVNTLEQPTTIGVRAAEQRLELLERTDVLQLGLDAANTAGTTNSIEKMLAHQLAAAHFETMRLLERGRDPRLQPADGVRYMNAAARFMNVYQAGALALQKLKMKGQQCVVVQYQQVNVGEGGQAVVTNTVRGGSRRKGRGNAGNHG